MQTLRGRVLVVEDNPDALSGIYALLANAGFEVRTAPNGAAAIDLLEEQYRPHVVVLDLMMPKVTGWQILKHLQGDPQLREVPVVVMTALDPAEAHVVGADVILQKPINPAELVSTVERLSAAATRR